MSDMLRDVPRQEFSHGQCVIAVMWPRTFEEFQEAAAAGFPVSATPEQRHEWGLDPADQLHTVDADTAVQLLFAEPGDPILDEFDTEMRPAPWSPDGEMRRLADRFAKGREDAAKANGQQSVEARVPAVMTLQVPRSLASPPGGGGDAAPAGEVAAPA